MTAGGDILAITNAALQSLNGPGMDFSPPEASSSSHSIFSPLPPKQATNLPLPDCYSATKIQLKSAEFSGGGGPYSAGGSPSTLSPLTISARDIDGGSADFTEFCAGSLSFSDSVDCYTAPQNASEKPHHAEIPLGQGSVNFLTPHPKGTSSPLVPVRVRVSASKLREIHSPHSSLSSTSAVVSLAPAAESSCGAGGDTPRALSQPTEEIRNQKYAIRACVQQEGALARKSLQQGILMDKGGPDPTTLSFSDDSVIVSDMLAGLGSDQKQSRLKLLDEISQGKNAAPISRHHLSTISQQVPLVKLSSSHSAQKADQKPVKRAKESYQEPQQAPSHSDITETAKLVATCTAAATAALLQQHHASNHTKPPGDEATAPLQSAAEHDHTPTSTHKHSLPAAKHTPQHSVTKTTVPSHLVQEMDKYGQEDGRIAHSGKHTITTMKQSQGQRKQLGLRSKACSSAWEDGNKLKPVADMNSTQEQISRLGAPYRDSCRLRDHRNKPPSPRKGEGRSRCLHPQDYPPTSHPKRRSHHSAPTQSGKVELAELKAVGTKNDFTSLTETKSKSPRSQSQSEEAQLIDVLKRIQKLEDYQHARNLEAAKVKASPISAKIHCSSLLSKPNKRAQHERENERERSPKRAKQRVSERKGPPVMAGGSRDGKRCVSPSQPLPPPPPVGEELLTNTDTFRASRKVDILDRFGETRGVEIMDPVEKSEGVDVVAHAQQVLGKVRLSKRNMEMQSELEEAEREFGDFVQALGSANEDGCQEGMPLKVAEFLSSVGLSGSGAAGEAGTHQSHSVDGVAVGVGKQKSKPRSRGVVPDDRPSPPHHQYIPLCGSHRHSSSSLPANTCVTTKSTCLQSHLPCNYKDPLVKRAYTSSLAGVPLQHIQPCSKHKLDTNSLFPYQSPQQQDWARNEPVATHSVKPPGMPTGALAAAIPLGAPCIMPSPFYDELDSKPGTSSITEQRYSCVEREVKLEECAVADIGLETNFHSQSENDEESGSSKSQLSLAASTQAMDEELASADEIGEGMDTVSIVGQKAATPPATSPTHLSPLCQPSNPLEAKGVTSEELDKRLQAHLKTQATEWIGRELLARMLSQLQCPLDPVPPHHHSHHDTNSCSTCTPDSTSIQEGETAVLDFLLGPDGVQKFIDGGIPINKSLVLALVKDILKEEVTKLVQEMAGRPCSPSQKRDESGDDFSYTPPESGSVVSSVTATPTISTPQATPPQSPQLEHAPDISASNELSLQEDLSTPVATPPFSQTEESSLATPQATEENISITSELELHSKSASSICHPEDVVSTPPATTTPEPISVGSPPDSQQDTLSQHLMQDRSQQVTPIQHTHEPLSESTTTTSSSHGEMSSSMSTSGREISAGELLTQRPHIAMGTSLSEGEVPYSPGDARWYSLYAATMNKAGLTGWKPKPKRKLDPTMETFLDLKNSPDPSTSESSQLSEDPDKVYSIGEVRESKRRPQEDPFKRFLSRLEALSPDSSSTPAGPNDNGSDNTLSEMPSIHHDEAATPVTAKHVRQKIRVIPYHQKYPLQKSGRSTAVNILGRVSPGEVPRHVCSVLRKRDDSKEESVWRWEAGEVDSKSKVEREEDNASDHSMQTSPETLRDGIDIINISRHGSLHPNAHEEIKPELSLAAGSIVLVQPASTSSNLQVTEIKPSDEESKRSRVESQAMNTAGEAAKRISTDVVVDLELSEITESPTNLESNKPVVGSVLKPLPVTIPTADMNPDSLSSVSEHVDISYSSDFDFSSISIPGL